MADRVEQGGPGAVGLGDDRRLGGAVGELLPLADGGGLGRERGEQPLVGGAYRSGDAEAELLAQGQIGRWSVVRRADVGDGGPPLRRLGAARGASTDRSPKVSRARPRSSGSEVSPRRMPPASPARIDASAEARPASVVRRTTRSTRAETRAATAMNTRSARALFLSEIVNV